MTHFQDGRSRYLPMPMDDKEIEQSRVRATDKITKMTEGLSDTLACLIGGCENEKHAQECLRSFLNYSLMAIDKENFIIEAVS